MLSLNKYLKIRILLLAVSVFLFKNIYSQNLIQNGSFEQYNTPINWNNWGGGFFDTSVFPFQRILLDWDEQNSADCFITACTHTYAGVPVNKNGYSFAKNGDNYCGFMLYAPSNEAKEYINQQLVSPLISGKIYCLSFYVSKADRLAYSIKNIGAYFSTSQPSVGGLGYINANPQVENTTSFLEDTVSWIKIEGCFIANGGEQFVTFGNFNSNANTDTLDSGTNNPLSSNLKFAYYYIDDITLIDQSTVGVNELNKESIVSVYPNPNNGLMHFNYVITKKAELVITDITGRVVNTYILDESQKSIIVNEHELNSGIYFYSVKQNNIVLKQEKFVIIK